MSRPAYKSVHSLAGEEKEVFYSVTINDLPRLREAMEPLSLSRRQQIADAKIEKKSSVYRASESGFREIITYLVAECGADVNSGYETRLGNYIPLFAAIGRSDLDTARTLVELGADIHWRDLTGVNTIVYACASGSSTIVKYLKEKGVEINGYTNVKLCSENLDYCKLSAVGGADFDYEDAEERTALMYAAAYGRHDIVNFLWGQKVGQYKRDKSGLNALCHSILNDQSSMTKQLLSFAYTIDDYITALKLCGANLLLFDRDVTVGLNYWVTAVCYRRRRVSAVQQQNLPPHHLEAPFTRGEFKSECDIKRLLHNKKERLLQVLLVYIRVLSADHPTTHDAFSYVSVATEITHNLTLALKLNAHLYRMYTGVSCPFLSAAEKAIANTVALFKTKHDRLDSDHGSLVTDHFDKAFDFINNHVWPELTEKPYRTFNRDRYGIFLSTILEFIGVVLEFTLSPDQEQKFKRQIQTIGNTYFDRYPTSLLHVAVQMKIPDQVLSYILDCGVEVNFQDEFKCTPLHLALENTFDLSRSRINLLINAGSHLDDVNDFDMMPLSKLLSIGMSVDHLSGSNLQCVASRAVQRNLTHTRRQRYHACHRDLYGFGIRRDPFFFPFGLRGISLADLSFPADTRLTPDSILRMAPDYIRNDTDTTEPTCDPLL